VNGPHHPWYVAIDLPGAGQLRYLRQLIESRPMLERIPDQSLIADALGVNDHIQATRGDDYAFIYTAQGKKFTVNTNKISGSELIAYWYNPKNGEIKEAGRFSKKTHQEFIAPSAGYGHDWVLILDDASKNFRTPGK
jgi:hypothetical protein